MKKDSNTLSIEHLYKSYSGKVILKDINFTINKSTITGLVGASGSGKSTLLRCIQGLEKIDSGTIHCNGKVGFMFQDFQLFHHMTILQNLTYAPNLHDRTGDSTKSAIKLLETLGIADKATTFPSELSGGQKQRVALARSLMMKPTLLLCDEPTSGSDTAMVENITILLKSVKDAGTSMIIASHDTTFLNGIVDKMIILKNGEIDSCISLK